MGFKVLPLMRALFLSFAVLSNAALAAPEAPQIFVLFGGFGSCATAGYPEHMIMTPLFNQLVKNLAKAKRQEIQSYKACYAIGSGTLYVTTPDGKWLSTTREKFFADLSNLAGQRNFVLIGQSHGGWTAMQATMSLPEGSVSHLFTLDPISVQDCYWTLWLRSTSWTVLGYKQYPGCTSAPKDLQESYGVIRLRVGYWLNAWQDDFTLLHSGPIDEAHSNFKAKSEVWRWYSPAGGHWDIELNREVWELMESSLTSTIGSGSPTTPTLHE